MAGKKKATKNAKLLINTESIVEKINLVNKNKDESPEVLPLIVEKKISSKSKKIKKQTLKHNKNKRKVKSQNGTDALENSQTNSSSSIYDEIDAFLVDNEVDHEDRVDSKSQAISAEPDSETEIIPQNQEILKNKPTITPRNRRISLITANNFSESDNNKSFPQIIPANMPVIANNFLRTWGTIDHKNYTEKKSFLVRGGGIVARSIKTRKYLYLIVALFLLEIIAIGSYKIYQRLTRLDVAKQLVLAINIGSEFINKNYLNTSNGVLKMNEFKRQNAVYKYNQNDFTHHIIKIDFNSLNKFAIVYTTNANVHLTGAKAVPDFESACSIIVLVNVKKGVDGSACYDPNNHSGIYDHQNLKDWGPGWIDDANYYLNKEQFTIYGDNLISFFGRLKLSAPDATIYPFNVGGEGVFWKDIALTPANLKYINFKPQGKSLKVYFSTLLEFTMDDVYPDTADSSRFDNVYSYFYDPLGLNIHQPKDQYGYFVLADLNGLIHISLDEQTQLLKRYLVQYDHNQFVKKPWSIDWSKVTDADLTKGFKLPIPFAAIFPSYVFLQQQ